MTKYIFMTGGVFSSLGKGLTAAAIALLIERRGFTVGMLKLDPYLNVDPGTMNPYQHGEVYVTDDGAETDLDLGHYYRFTNAILSKFTNATSGQIYDTVIKKERHGEYLGRTVQVIPHITDEIKQRILLAKQASADPDFLFVEIGGTVGDIESLPFLEAIRQFKLMHPKDCVNIHLTYVPFLPAAGELKTKPTQHSVQMLRSIGIIPDLIICRAEEALPKDLKEKIALFCSVSPQAVIDAPDVEHSIYQIPLVMQKAGVDAFICDFLSLPSHPSNLDDWKQLMDFSKSPKQEIVIGVVGKYIQHQDAYKSIFEALEHAALHAKVDLKIKSFDSEKITPELFSSHEIKKCQGFLIPGGFGSRGWEGKIAIAKYCRENKIPYFGICLGMQVMAVEFARNVLGLKEANSTEMQPETPDKVISLLTEQKNIKDVGGTMRLGAFACNITPDTLAASIYKKALIQERHRHRYEFNNSYESSYAAHGLIVSGKGSQNHLCEIMELQDHPWMLGVQFHPEFKSKPIAPHPLFSSFINAAISGAVS
jgi:CTP synthase